MPTDHLELLGHQNTEGCYGLGKVATMRGGKEYIQNFEREKFLEETSLGKHRRRGR
jgi:hypothetical protein